MQTTLRRAASLLAALVLAGCGLTIPIGAPHGTSEKFTTCVKNPTTSYDPAPGAVLMDAPAAAQAMAALLRDGLADASGGQFFVTDAEVAREHRALPWRFGEPPEASVLSVVILDTPNHELNDVTDKIDSLWHGPVHQAAITSFNMLAGKPGKADVPVSVSARDLREYVRLAAEIVERQGWDAYAMRADKAYSKAARMGLPVVARRLSAQKLTAALFVRVYLTEYFRNGRVVSGKAYSENPIRILDDLARHASGDDRTYLADILKRLSPGAKEQLDAIIAKTPQATVLKAGEASFVTRGGDALAVPPLTIDIKDNGGSIRKLTVSEIDVDAATADVIRVIFEALFDAINHVPAVSNATGLGLDLGDARLKDFAKVHKKGEPGKAVMSGREFDEVERLGATAHSLSAASSASIVRGVGLVALNNEALAKGLAALLGTVARKVTERVAWCYYATAVTAAPGAAPRAYRSVPFHFQP